METYGEVYQEFKATDVNRAGRVFGYIFAVRDVMATGLSDNQTRRRSATGNTERAFR